MLVVKLAFIMGITWTREVIGAFFQDKEIYNNHIKKFEIFLDFVTCLQGELKLIVANKSIFISIFCRCLHICNICV